MTASSIAVSATPQGGREGELSINLALPSHVDIEGASSHQTPPHFPNTLSKHT
eukprot:COSAG06_NODE_62942_length_263_cov_1.292683_1_plen_52_part_01